MTSRQERERRWALRARVPATATLRDEHGCSFRYEIDNISVMGALLSNGPLIPIGVTVTMLLTLDAELSVSMAAKVVRHRFWSGQGSSLGVVFLTMSVDARRLILRAVLGAGPPAHKVVGNG